MVTVSPSVTTVTGTLSLTVATVSPSVTTVTGTLSLTVVTVSPSVTTVTDTLSLTVATVSPSVCVLSDVSTADVSEESPPPASPVDIKENIRSKFLVEMPQDFYDFWDFAKSLSKNKPQGIKVVLMYY